MTSTNHDSALVSVIIPSYNRAKILPPTLESVLAQTYPHLEVIVIDDGSTDETAAVVAGYGERVRYIRQENQGVEMARNRGILESRGAYLNFLDDDDLMAPDKIERQVKVLQSRSDVGVVHCGYTYIDKEGHKMEVTGRMPEGDVLQPLVWGCFPWSGGPLLRRRCLELIASDEHRDWFGDWGMWLRTALGGYSWACIQEPLGQYRIIPGSMTDDKVANAERLVFHILDAVFTHWDVSSEITKEKNQIYAGWHFWISCRYYLGGFWEDGQRSLRAVIRLHPELINNPNELVKRFYWDATSPRVRVQDPIRFIENVFDHLPAEAAPLRAHRDRLLGQLALTLALFDCGAGRLEQARERFGMAIAMRPDLVQQSQLFMDAVYECAQKMDIDAPLDYLDTVFQSLPADAAGLVRLRSSLLGEMTAAKAFRAFQTGHRADVPPQVLRALWLRPSLLRNKGVLSIFMKSLPSLMLARSD